MKLTITLLIALLLSGCTTTGTTIQEKLKDETTTNNGTVGHEETSGVGIGSETELHEVSPVVETGEGNTEELNKAEDTSKVSALNWTSTGDPHHIVQCYFGHGHDSELFKMIAQLPIDFTCTLGKGITITKPESDDTACMTSYPGDHMQARRAFTCFFDANGNLTACEDFANTLTFDSRWKGRGEVKGLIVHCKRGNAVSRTALKEVK